MISVDEARFQILKELSIVDTEVVSLDKALGRVLTEDVMARRTQPPSHMSAMDGFAVKAADTQSIPANLKIIGDAPAGGSFEGIVRTGETVRIFTGGPLPEGTDSIVIQEDTNLGEDSQKDGYVEIRETTPVGHYVRPAGLDFQDGTIGLTANRRLSARDIGLLAAMNVPWVTVCRKPRIALLSTGDELVRPGEPVGPNQIISSNSLLVAALIQQSGGEAIDLGIAKDNEDSLRQMAAGAKSADMLVTLGGASVGDHDLVQSVLGKEGLSVDFWRIAMRPGKPLMSGDLNGTPMLGMPGNPVSSMICSFLFLIPAIDALLGLPPRRPPLSTAVIAHSVKENDQREDYLRARIIGKSDGLPVVELFDKQDSSMLSPLAAADCLVLRGPFASSLPAQSQVEIIHLKAGYPDV
ncbi:molybdopterin molybdotransferase MoeA [Sneathiella marina]|uniref:Molybdopterin molybdenumtransferase n=1 Tax=Sneathiella marina TaxID=2950108 RepID=A0ABY4VXD8_9PROT|nr:gephyrin-like molybdotransferase Glp [Sneathiella marina]USG59600.1 molybdopterin molybdotransferase MoeA [Sneathiella marina]